jgi:GTP-binding protein HflX
LSTRILLVGVATTSRLRWAKADSLEELAALTRTAGGEVVERLIQVRPRLDPATLVGSGMVGQLRALTRMHGVDLLIFDEELSPTQQRNLEDAVRMRVIDRAALILDIFALHARTAEAKTQVELAQLEYRRPRLTGFGVELSRLGAGIGTRGPGETKLEVDRRRLDQRIAALRRALERIDRERATQRGRRLGMYRIVLAGYTNAGKSTLLNRLTAAGARVSDQLFATLDANTKALDLSRQVRVLVTDTVGFIRNLPAQLVASFRSTLSEIREASLILHVADASDDQVDRRIDAVNETLGQIGAADKPTQLVFSKTDVVYDDAVIGRLRRGYAGCRFVSAHSGQGIDELKGALLARIESKMVSRAFTLPVERGDLVAMVRRSGKVARETHDAGKVRIRLAGDPADLARCRREVDAALGRSRGEAHGGRDR